MLNDYQCCRFVLLLLFLVGSNVIAESQNIKYINPVINTYTYHDASVIQGDDDKFYSFVSSIVPRDTTDNKAYYTVSIFRSNDLVSWDFYKYAFDDKCIEKRLVNEHDRVHGRYGKFPYHKDGNTKYYAIWAPDIFKHNGKYYLFVSFHLSIPDTKIAVFESKSLNEDFKFSGIIASSDNTETDVYVDAEELIDPFPIKVGRRMYLMYGSFRKDIKGNLLPKRKKMGVYISEMKLKKGRFRLGKRKFVTDYYEGCMVIPHGGKYWLLGTNGSLMNSTYKIDRAVSYNITGPYLNEEGLSIADTINYTPGDPILKTTSKHRFNGFGCPSNPIIDKNGQYWMMMHGHASEYPPIQMDKAEAERYTFLIPLYWDKDGKPYFDVDEIQRNKIRKPVL